MRTNLGNLTEVDNMSDILETDTPTVIGLLFLFWSYADDNSADGELTVSGKAIDRRTAPGFSDALRKVGWLAGRDGSLTLPNFNRHNGSSAKARALEAEAKRLRRAAKETEPSPDSSDSQSDTRPNNNVRQVSDTMSDQRREEKNREEPPSEVPPKPPKGGGGSRCDGSGILVGLGGGEDSCPGCPACLPPPDKPKRSRARTPSAESLISAIPADFPPELRPHAEEWARDKQGRGQAKERFQSVNAWLKALKRMALYPEPVLAEAIEQAIASGWRGWEHDSTKAQMQKPESPDKENPQDSWLK
mgnify:FL=1